MDTEDPERARLAQLVDQLADQVESERAWLQNREPTPSLIDWFVKVSREYLDGKHPSMDHALGLKPGIGPK